MSNAVQVVDEGGFKIQPGNPFPVTDYFFEVAEGNVADREFVHKFGRNPDIDSGGGFEAIWNGGNDYTGFDATSAETIEVFSSVSSDAGTVLSSGSVTTSSLIALIDSGATFVSDGVAVGDMILNDTGDSHAAVKSVTSETELEVSRFDRGSTFTISSAVGDAYRIVTTASTGASCIQLQGLLDEDLANQSSEFIVLNGTTGVDSVGTYRRNSRCSVLQAGSNSSNIGAITSRQKTTTANIFVLLPIGYNQSMIAAYTIPVGFEGHMNTWFSGLSGKTNANCNVRFLARHFGEVFSVREEFSLMGAGTSYVLRNYRSPKNDFPGGTDIKIMADTDTNNTAIAAGFDLILSKD